MSENQRKIFHWLIPYKKIEAGILSKYRCASKNKDSVHIQVIHSKTQNTMSKNSSACGSFKMLHFKNYIDNSMRYALFDASCTNCGRISGCLCWL